MGVIETALEFQRKENLDAVWLQVGAFMEMYGDPAVALSDTYGLVIWHRDGVKTVGVPVSHIYSCAIKTTQLGFTVGLAFQVEKTYRLSREITSILRNNDGLLSFSATGNLQFLGSIADSTQTLQVNQIFSIDLQVKRIHFVPHQFYLSLYSMFQDNLVQDHLLMH
jgi:hypothetical protein